MLTKRPATIAIVVLIAAILCAVVFLGAHRSRLLWGAYIGKSDGNLEHNGDLAAFESLVGSPVDIQAAFLGWGHPFPAELGADLKPANKVLWIYWLQNGAALDDISAGTTDAYIQSVAAAAKSYGGPVVLAPLHEMNGNWNDWSGTVGANTPAKVIAAWRHIHDAFAGVPNVAFAWVVNNGSVPDTAANALEVYYPGDAYVDYVGVDGFNFGDPWTAWSDVFSAPLMARLGAYHKPIFISSTGSVPGPDEAAWITAMGSGLKQYPQIAGWIWFNQSDPNDDFRMDVSSSTLAAFKTIIPK